MLCRVRRAVGDEDTIMMGKIRGFFEPGLEAALLAAEAAAAGAEPLPPLAADLSCATYSFICVKF